MTLELILWIVAGIILSEGLYILGFTKFKKELEIELENWKGMKILSFIVAFIFLGFQYIILSTHRGVEQILSLGEISYIRILYEVLIISGIVLFFYGNKKLAEHLCKKGKKK